MVRLVTVAVHQHDVAGAHQRLHHDLVAGRGAVGRKEGLLGAEGARGQFLCLLDGPVRFEQRIEPARGRRGLGEKDVGPVEGAHVLDPVAARDRLAAADRHRMEHAGRLLGIVHQRGEERRLVACLDTAEDVQVQLHEVFLVVEDPAADPEIEPGDGLHRAFGDQVGIELGAQLGDQAAEFGAVILRVQRVDLVLPLGAVDVARQQRHLEPRLQRESGAHHDGLDVVVEQHRDQRVLKARHHDRLVLEGIFRPPHALHVGPQPAFLMLVHVIDDQHLEVGLGHRARLGREHRLVVLLVLFGAVLVDRNVPPPIGARGERPQCAMHRKCKLLVMAGGILAAHVVEGLHPRKRPVGLDHLQRGPKHLDALFQRGHLPFRAALSEGIRRFAQGRPAVRPQLDRGIVFVHRLHRFSLPLRRRKPRDASAKGARCAPPSAGEISRWMSFP